MYIGRPLTSSQSFADQAPKATLADEAGSAGTSRAPSIRPGFLFRPSSGYRLTLLDDANSSLPDILHRADALEICLVEDFPLLFGLSCRFHLGGDECSEFRTTVVAWQRDPGRHSQLEITQPHLMPNTAKLLEVVAVDENGTPLARRSALLSDVCAARLNARIARTRAAKPRVVPEQHEAIIRRFCNADIENVIPAAKRTGDWCLVSLVQVSHFWRGLATNTLMYKFAGFRPR